MAQTLPDAILVAVDFSPPSTRALDTALAWRTPGADVTALHVVDTDLAARMDRTGVCPYDEAIARMRRYGEAGLAALQAERPKGAFETMLVEGLPFVEIVKIARDLDCKLIVMGCYGEGSRLEGMLFGTTAEKVVRSGRVPVLCVP